MAGWWMLFVLAPSAVGQTTFWINPGTGAWETPANWSLGFPTNTIQNGTIDNGGTVEKLLDNPANVLDLVVGDNQQGTLKVLSNGILQSQQVILGQGATGLGLGQVIGPNNRWSADRGTVGDAGTGQLDILDGGFFEVGQGFSGFESFILGKKVGSVGTVNVDGAGSVFRSRDAVVIGQEGTGTWTVSNGGLASALMKVGNRPGSLGDVRVTDGGVLNSTLFAGVRGEGKLLVKDGGKMGSGVSVGLSLGLEAGSIGDALFDGIGTTGQLRDVRVGVAGQGSFIVQNGAKVEDFGSPDGMRIGIDAGGEGTVKVTGPGSSLNVRRLTVGGLGTGKFTIENGASARVPNSTVIFPVAVNQTGEFAIRGAGSQFTTDDSPFLMRGTLTVEQGGMLDTRNLLVDVGDATIQGEGTEVKTTFLSLSGGGDVTVRDGARVTVSNSTSFTNLSEPRGIGRLRIEGEGTRWQGGEVFLGGFLTAADPIMVVADGAQVQSAVVLLGTSNSEFSVLVDGAGSSWKVDGDLNVGREGKIQLRIENGATVTSRTAQFNTSTANSFGSDESGSVSVTGEGSVFVITEKLTIGRTWGGNVSVADGGLVRAAAGSNLVRGLVDIGEGGTFESSSFLVGNNNFLPNASTFLRNNGTFDGNLLIRSGGVVTGSGEFVGTVDLGALGIFSPGNSPGEVSTPVTNWGFAGTYLWEINALASQGGVEGGPVGWDLWNTGSLTVGSLFRISLRTLDGNNNPGGLTGWDPLRSQLWRIATADNPAFLSLAPFQLDTTGFAPSLGGGTLGLRASADGRELYVRFSAVPEGGTCLLTGMGLVLGVMGRWLRTGRRL
jgi:T5SS/PEP-CTERM-associated repeat protein